MTYTDHVAAIRNLISKGAASKDLRITDRLIGHFLNIARASVINKFPSSSNWQTICVALETGALSDICTDCVLPETCTSLMRSIASIPNTVTSTKEPITVRTIDGNTISKGSLQNQKHKEYSLTQQNNKISWFIYNQSLYLISDRTIPMVFVDGIFSTPEDISNLTNCEDTTTSGNCFDGSMLYPIDAKAVNAVYELTMRMLSQAYRFGEDRSTDARDLAIDVLKNNKR